MKGYDDMSNISASWEVIVQDLVGTMRSDIWLIMRDGVKPSIAQIKDGQIKLEELKEGESEVKPTLSIHYDAWQAIKKAMIDDKVREKSEVEAELKATKYHLEDMRKLAKVKD